MTVETKTHSKLGASSANRWLNCAGSVALIEQCPPAPTSEFAEEGTAAHELAEKCFKEGAAAKYYFLTKAKMNNIVVTEEMAEHVQKFVDYVINLRNELGAELLIEHKFHLAHLHPKFFGTCDIVLMQPFGELHVIDFKYGAGISVEVEENEQIMYYGIGALDLGDFNKVVLHVCQPRLDHEDGAFRKWETTPERLIEFGKELRAGALRTQKKDAPLKSGEWCRFCPAAAICPALHTTAMEVAKTDFKSDKLPEVVALTDEQIAKVIEHKLRLEAWLDAVKTHATTLLMQGKKIPGLKLVSGQTRRAWIDEKSAEETLCRELGEDAFTRKLLTVPQAEKALGKDFVAGMFQSTRGVPTVAHESDRRKALASAQDDFGILESDF